MTVLSTVDRTEVWAQAMREIASTLGITKAELRAAVDAVDDWIEANQSAYNSAIPQPARTQLSAQQKAALLMFVVARRFNVSV